MLKGEARAGQRPVWVITSWAIYDLIFHALWLDTVEANLALGFPADSRDYGIGIQILKDLGLSKVRLLTNNPKKTDAFIYGGFDLEVVDQVPIQPPPNKFNERYLATKREKLGHKLPKR